MLFFDYIFIILYLILIVKSFFYFFVGKVESEACARLSSLSNSQELFYILLTIIIILKLFKKHKLEYCTNFGNFWVYFLFKLSIDKKCGGMV